MHCFYNISWFVIFLTEIAKDTFEDMEDIDYLRDKCANIPKAKELVARLKTKVVQDPLMLDSKGIPLKECYVLRSVWFIVRTRRSDMSNSKTVNELVVSKFSPTC